MIQIRITPTLFLTLLLAALVLLMRAPQAEQPAAARRPAPFTPRRQSNGHARRSAGTYADAIRAPYGTYTDQELQEMADREALDAARDTYESRASERPFIVFTQRGK